MTEITVGGQKRRRAEITTSMLTFLLISLTLALVFELSVITVLHDYLVYRDLRRRLMEEREGG
ncbi:unnamed protein product [marine sediment metagenome]|uniref:Uncharacterized protein n=1 Tax=marine sediment metagenome TaxID=412755 RepID=X1V628_9ZZZZ